MGGFGYIFSIVPIFIFIVFMIISFQFRRITKIDHKSEDKTETETKETTPVYLFCPACNTKFSTKKARRCHVCRTDYICPTCRRCRNADQHRGI